MKTALFIIALFSSLTLTLAQAESELCLEASPIPAEVSTLAPIEVDIFLGEEAKKPWEIKKKKDSFYETKDLALDLALYGGIMATKPYLAEDKYKHLLIGAVIGSATTLAAKAIFRGQDNAKMKAIAAGFTAVTLIGIAKELRDRKGFGTPDVKDAIVTSLGGALVAVRFHTKF